MPVFLFYRFQRMSGYGYKHYQLVHGGACVVRNNMMIFKFRQIHGITYVNNSQSTQFSYHF